MPAASDPRAAEHSRFKRVGEPNLSASGACRQWACNRSVQHGLRKCLANGVVGKLFGVLFDPLQRSCLYILQVIVGIVDSAITLDLTHLLTHSCAEKSLFIGERNAHQITLFTAQAPGYIARAGEVGIECGHAHLQCGAMTPGTVVIASDAAEADSVQLLPRNALRFEQRQFDGHIIRMRNKPSHEHRLPVSAI